MWKAPDSLLARALSRKKSILALEMEGEKRRMQASGSHFLPLLETTKHRPVRIIFFNSILCLQEEDAEKAVCTHLPMHD